MNDDTKAKWSARWPHIRAALISFHIVAAFLMGFPAPAGVLQRSAWAEPSVKNEMHIWAERSRSVGFTWDDEEFKDFLWVAAEKILAVRKVILTPFKPYGDTVGARQSWRMFSAPHRFPVRFIVEVHREKKWETIYESRSSTHTYMVDTFDHHRIRRLVFLHGWKRYNRRFGNFVAWLAEHVADDFPDADMMRVRQWKYRTPTPEERRQGILELDGKNQKKKTVKLDKVRRARTKKASKPTASSPRPKAASTKLKMGQASPAKTKPKAANPKAAKPKAGQP